ncbi:hypothetical protein GW626_10310 [Peribacillus muralis]|uniref:hypothetical protein n=1 Tax=Peribacillus muralis TaxID=264697 RepID=UPI001F4D8BD4|nr:hypothetical protein [Peribacillus muralis]MCK1993543.1 hypothetical protein [Peribacillus muralis]MCK2014169.1 hypothetical protein [Peribacillus muralis]
MYLYTYKVQPNQPINRWIHTDLKIEPYQSTKASFDHPVNITEEYVQIVYPGRQQFLDERKNEEIQITDSPFENIYFPFENRRFEFSAFIPTPHLLSVYGKTYLTSQHEEILPFTLSTCGRVEIWVNNRKQVSWTPYTRNQVSHKQIQLTLEKGINEIVLYMDDLAERDVNYFMELKYTGQTEIEGYFPVNVAPEKMKKAEALLTSLYFSKDLYHSGNLEIYLDRENIDEIQQLFVNVNRNKLLNPVLVKQSDENTPLKYDYTYTIEPSNLSHLSLMPISSLSSNGLTYFDIGVVVEGEMDISRRMVASVFTKDYSSRSFSDDLSQRKMDALKFFTESDTLDLNVGIAMTHLNGKVDTKAIQHITSVFDEIENKGDCADFRLAPLLGYTIKYKDMIPNEFHREIEELAINFRYWIDEPGNDVMWYFSENHALLFHVSQYFAGHLYAEKQFTVSGRTGKEQYEKGKERLEEWFEVFLKYGYSEWNSTTYLPIDLIGFFSLYDSAPDQHIRELAKKSLDLTFKIIAVNLHGKTMSTTYGRVYEHDLKAMELGEIANLSYITWKKGNLNTAMRSSALFCISDYIPPRLDEYFVEEDSKALVTQYMQGIKKVYTYNYKTKNYCMSSAINFNAFQKGHQQHTMNLSLGQDNTQIWLNHPGETVFSGENRPSFWAGNGISPNIRQYKNYMLLEYRLKEPFVPFIHVYLPFWKLDEIIESDNWLFVRKDKTYLAIYFSEGYERIMEGAVAFREVRSYGAEHKVFVTCSSEYEHQSFHEFVNEQLQSIIEIKDNEWFYRCNRVGTLAMIDDELYLNHQKVEYNAGYEVEDELLEL